MNTINNIQIKIISVIRNYVELPMIADQVLCCFCWHFFGFFLSIRVGDTLLWYAMAIFTKKKCFVGMFCCCLRSIYIRSTWIVLPMQFQATNSKSIRNTCHSYGHELNVVFAYHPYESQSHQVSSICSFFLRLLGGFSEMCVSTSKPSYKCETLNAVLFRYFYIHLRSFARNALNFDTL